MIACAAAKSGASSIAGPFELGKLAGEVLGVG
jgi:hypothetical protein